MVEDSHGQDGPSVDYEETGDCVRLEGDVDHELTDGLDAI